MGCGGSKLPEDILVQQSDHPDHVLIQGALSANTHIELHSRIAKDTGLTTVMTGHGAPLKKPSVKIYEKPEGGGIVMQLAQDLCGQRVKPAAKCDAHRPPHPARLRWAVENQRDPVTTFFDAAGKPAAVLVGNAKRASNDLRSVLYARDVPGLSTINLNDMVAGQVFRTVDAKKTMEDGTVMHAVGIIRRVYTGDGAPLGLYRVDPEAGQFKTGDAEMQFAGLGNITDIVNGKKETIAYTDLTRRKVFVAAGVDAVLAVALFAATDANERTAVSEFKGGGRGGAGGGRGGAGGGGL